MKNRESSLLALLAFSVAAMCAVADDFAVSAWRGETLSVLVPDYTELGEPPAGLEVRCGVLRPVRYRPSPAALQIAESYDVVEWGASDSVGPRVAEISVPRDAKPGVYKWGLMDINVVDRELPPPSQWKYYLDLWQHPWAVARYAKVQPFSKAHYAAMRPLWELLASAGQKTLTVTLVDRPWHHQCRDAYGSMVFCRKDAEGRLTVDFSLFDEYVEFGRSCGIGPHIACYSVSPWGSLVGWTDANGETVKVKARLGSKEYEEFWGPFLKSFAAHLKEKGWFDDAYISMDESKPETMKRIADFVQAHAPGMKIALAGNHRPSEFKGIKIDSYSQNICGMTEELLAEVPQRRKAGFVTTYYVCCGPTRPNTFLSSKPAESFWVGVFPEMAGLDGLLRWAWNSWPEDPFVDGSFRNWFAGDTYLAYPGGVPSFRFLELRNGIATAEKLRILKEKGLFKDEMAELAKRYGYKSAMAGKTDFAKLKEDTLKLVNR